jgi:RNA polymerase sigma-70 factor, ECF subfamily
MKKDFIHEILLENWEIIGFVACYPRHLPNAANDTSREAHLDEASLMRLAVRQDEAAWEALMHAHQEAVFRLAYLFTGDTHDAEDVTQEAFIRAFRHIDQFEQGRAFRPWVLSIAANLARNRLRGISRYLGVLQRMARRDPAFISATAPQAGSEGQALWQDVRRLGLEDQQVIYLRYFMELSEQETAAVLQIPPGTVKSRLHRALKRLRTALEARGEVPQGVSHE